MRSGTRTVLSMSNHYQGPASNFAMVVPVPVVLQRAKTYEPFPPRCSIIHHLTSPRLVEYWEIDPCYVPPPQEEYEATVAYASPPGRRNTGSVSQGVRIEAQFTVGEYEVLVLSANQSNGLEAWLHEHQYNIPQGAAPNLTFETSGSFSSAKVDIQKVHMDANGVAELSPLRFHYDSQDFRLPVRLGLLNAPESQDLIVYLLSENQRYEVSNYPNAFIPTNLNVEERPAGHTSRSFTRSFSKPPWPPRVPVPWSRNTLG